MKYYITEKKVYCNRIGVLYHTDINKNHIFESDDFIPVNCGIDMSYDVFDFIFDLTANRKNNEKTKSDRSQ